MAERYIRHDDAPTPEEEARALEDALEDNRHLPPPVEPVLEAPPVGRSWAFDFVAERFVVERVGRGPVQTNGIATLLTWCEKALRTARGAHSIYPSDYGMPGANRWIGKALTGADYAQMSEAVQEALTFHPRILDVVDFEFTQEDEALYVTCRVLLDDDVTLDLDRVLIGAE